METIFINAIHSRVGGGLSILNSLLQLLGKKTEKRFVVLCWNPKAFKNYKFDNVKLISVPNIIKIKLLFPIINSYIIPMLLWRYKANSILNLCDIPVPTSVPQVYLFDWPYAVYPESEAWHRMDWGSYIYRKIKLWFFCRKISIPKVVIAQSETMSFRLKRLYKINRVEVVPNALPLENLKDIADNTLSVRSQNNYQLLCLTHYYPHKNLEILIPLAEKIRDKKLPYKILLTIDIYQHKKAEALIHQIKQKQLENILINLGSIPNEDVPQLYKKVDALILPTLLESFSGTYIEAMYHKKLIFTSDLDFAKDVCKDAAYYFDPLSADSILEALDKGFNITELADSKIAAGFTILQKSPSWNNVLSQWLELLDTVTQKTP